MSTEQQQNLEVRVRDLPVLPAALVKLMSLDAQSEDFFDELLDVVQSEPNYTVRILAAANSSLSGSVVPVSTLRTAIARIGSRGAMDLVTALSVVRVFVPHTPEERGLWRHAIQVATTARALARLARDPECRPGEAYVCALLHDIGHFVLFQERPEILHAVEEAFWDDPEGLLATEKALCGVTHAELGAWACRHWGLPPVIRECVLHHHDAPEAEPQGRRAKLQALVRVADLAMFPAIRPESPPLCEASDEMLERIVHRELPAFVPLDLDRLRSVLRTCTEEAESLTAALGLG